MKKFLKIICLIVTCFIINLMQSSAEEKYIHFVYYNGEKFIKTPTPGSNFLYSEYYISLQYYSKENIFGQTKEFFKGTAYNDTNTSAFVFGEEEELEWDKDYYPNYIVVKNVDPGGIANNVKWEGSDNAKGNKGDHIFILESYYKSQNYALEKSCLYPDTGMDFHEFAIVKDGSDVYALSKNSYVKITDITFNLNISQKVLDKVKNFDGCPNITYCNVRDLQPNDAGYLPDEFYVFLDDIEAKASDKCKTFYWFSAHNVDINNSIDDDKVDYCDSYDTFFSEFSKNYKTCKNNYINCQEANDAENKLKNLCNSITQTQDYGKSPCLRSCLKLSNELAIEKGFTSINVKCGFSHKLIVYFKNILRWIKYIMPVAVIVLGILDFIKAIGADKDDEMKKAQKRFVIRLISAALIFIIPLIIEFVLGKMGFGYDDCGIFK